MAVEQWFFAEIDAMQYALLRMGVGCLITLYLIQLYPLSVLHFSSDGWLADLSTSYQANFTGWSVFYFFSSETYVKLFWIIAILFSTTFTLGFKTSFSGWITWIALVSLLHRNPLILDGDDAILRIVLLYLLFSPCGYRYSIDAFSKQLPKRSIPVWPLRMIQIQLCILYFVSGWVKFNSQQWLDGSILQVVLLHPQYSRWNLSSLLEQSWFISTSAALCFLIRWWELLFPLLLCQKHSRMLCIVIGVLFHLGLLLFMHLRLFPIIMLVLYLALLPQSWFDKKDVLDKAEPIKL